MQPYYRQMSYDPLKCIVPRLKYGQRLHLSSLSRLIRGIHRRSDPLNFSLSFLKFHQTYSNPDCTTGVLFVESVKYSFEWIEPCHVEIRCLGRKRVSSEKDAAIRYFEYFLRTSKLPVRQLELIHCQKQFHNFHDRPIPRLKVHRHPNIVDVYFEGFPVWHQMEEAEVIDFTIEDFERGGFQQFSFAKCLIINSKIDESIKQKNEADLMIRYVFALEMGLFKTTMQLNYPSSFAAACLNVIGQDLELGSYFTAILPEKYSSSSVYAFLLRWSIHGSFRREEYERRDCLVVSEKSNWKVLVIKDYFGEIEGKTCYTAIKVPRKAFCIPENEMVQIRFLIDETNLETINEAKRWFEEYNHGMIDITRAQNAEQCSVATLSVIFSRLKSAVNNFFVHLNKTIPLLRVYRQIKLLLHRSQAVLFMDSEAKKTLISSYLFDPYHYERITIESLESSTDKVLQTYGDAADIEVIVAVVLDVMHRNPIIGESLPYQPN